MSQAEGRTIGAIVLASSIAVACSDDSISVTSITDSGTGATSDTSATEDTANTADTSETSGTEDTAETDDETETEDTAETDDCPEGTLDCPCAPGPSCDDGLECNEEELCVPPPLAECGNGALEPGEACDDGNDIPDDECTNACALPSCGDGIVHAGEDCDDGNLDDADACLNTCVSASCGDQVVWAGVEDCDDGNALDDDACLSSCTAASCGDGIVWAGVEGCEDGNLEDLDGCNVDCQVTASLEWEQILDSDVGACDYYYGVDVGPSDSIVVVGSLSKSSDPEADCQIIVERYDGDGNLLWSDIPDTGAHCDEAWGVEIDANGSVWVAGHVYHPARRHDQWVRRYDAAGQIMWTRTFDAGGEDFGYGIAVDQQNRGILVGSSQIGTGSDVSIRALTPEGAPVWARLIDQGSSDFALDVMTAGSKIFVAGFLTVDGQNQNAWAAQLDLAGTVVWSHLHNGPKNSVDRAGGIARAPNGTLAVAGFETGAVNHDIWVRRLDSGGNELWTQTWDDPLLAWADRAQEVAIDQHGNIVVVGQHWTPGLQINSFDAWMRKYDPSGAEVWTVLDNGGADGEDVWFAVDIASDGDIIVAGAMTTEPDACTKAVLRRYNP